jgi:hypothetical protein
VNPADASLDHAAASQRKQQAARGYEISVEALEQGQQRCHQDDADNPCNMPEFDPASEVERELS